MSTANDKDDNVKPVSKPTACCLPMSKPDINNIFVCSQRVSDEIIRMVSSGIGPDWNKLALSLQDADWSFTAEELNGFNSEYIFYGDEFTLRDMLKFWSKKRGQYATVGRLARALDYIGRSDLILWQLPM